MTCTRIVLKAIKIFKNKPTLFHRVSIFQINDFRYFNQLNFAILQNRKNLCMTQSANDCKVRYGTYTLFALCKCAVLQLFNDRFDCLC